MGSVSISRSSTWKSVTVALATSTTISNAFDARPGAIYGLIIPATFEGSSLGFQVSHDNSTFVDLYDNTGTIVALACTVSRAYDLPTALSSQGGPGYYGTTLALLVIRYVYENYQMGKALAVATIMSLIAIVFSYFELKLLVKREVHT